MLISPSLPQPSESFLQAYIPSHRCTNSTQSLRLMQPLASILERTSVQKNDMSFQFHAMPEGLYRFKIFALKVALVVTSMKKIPDLCLSVMIRCFSKEAEREQKTVRL